MAQTYTDISTLKSLAAGAAIGNLTARYNRAYETGDRTGWLSTFVPEGVLETATGEVIAGHPALGKYFSRVSRRGVLVVTDPQLAVEGPQGRQECRFVLLAPATGDSGIVVQTAGRFHDELVYERGGWYFTRRVVVVDLGDRALDGIAG